MKLYFLRHGQANWENWNKPDDERPLTKKGRKEMEGLAERFRDLKLRPHVILSSPLPRAHETAQIVAEELDVELVTAPRLAPGFDSNALRELVGEHSQGDVMLVGHEPDFSTVIAWMTGGNVILAKAGLARVDLEDLHDLRGQLVWLLPPKALK
jgi:phosphohistidine phosphatase